VNERFHGLLAALLAVCASGWIALVFASDRVFWALLFDDSFYYFAIGRHLARGEGSTFDGINPTNGYHPLWMAVCTLPYALGLDGDVAAAVLLGESIAAMAVAFGLVAITARRKAVAGAQGVADAALLVVVGLLAVDPLVVRLFGNGLETGVYTAALAATLAWWDRIGDPLAASRAERLALGGLLGVAFLGRTDLGLLLPCLGLATLPTVWRRGLPAFVAACEWLGPPAAAILGYLAVNRAVFGAAMQVSGELKRQPFAVWRVIVAGAVVAAAFAAARAAGRATGLPRLAQFMATTAPFAVFSGILVAYYTVLQGFPRLWYFAPVALYAIALLLHAALDLVALAVAEKPDQPPERASRPVLALLALPLLAAAGILGRQTLDPSAASPMRAAREAALWSGENLPPKAILAGWDAGVIGYYCPRPVVNLDGVVNAPAWVEALRNGTTAARLRDQHVTHVINHDDAATGATTMQADAAALFGADAVDGWTLVKSWPFVFEGSTNSAGNGTHEMAVFLFALPAVDERR
jgi:hypothetical protein